MPNLTNLAFQASNKLSSMIGNPGQMMSPEIYNTATDYTQLNQYRVAITSYDSSYTVTGLLTNNLSLNVDATWEATGMLDQITSNPLLSKLYGYATMFAGASGIANPSNVGVSTRKIYSHSGYLEFNIQFRVVDWQGTGEPIKSAFILSSMCLPKNRKSFSAAQLASSGSSLVISSINKALSLSTNNVVSPNALGGLASGVGSAITELANTASGLLNGVAQAAPITKGLMDLFGDSQFLVIAASPLPVMVEIGGYFRHTDMVVQGVKMEFSRHCTEAGPLYSDFDISVSSRQAVLLDDSASSRESEMGLLLNGKPRVSRFVGPVQ